MVKFPTHKYILGAVLLGMSFIHSQCYNYLSDEVPIIVEPKLNKRIPVLSIQVMSAEGKRAEEKITDLYVKYLEETGYFGRVISGGVRAPYHIDIYTAVIDEYEHAFLTVISSIFSLGTAGLLPAISGERRILRAKIYREEELIAERVFSQKHVTLYSLIFIFIWERGIEESEKIQFNKEKNLIHNLVESLNDYQ